AAQPAEEPDIQRRDGMAQHREVAALADDGLRQRLHHAAVGAHQDVRGARGVDPARLVFADRTPMPLHIGRQVHGDLFLDTAPYNAHTTTSDALWMGLPVITCPGETFAGRVAASLLKAADLPELVVKTWEDYERLAVSLAQSPEKIAALKNRLRRVRTSSRLFDSRLFTRNLEAAYTAMYERLQAGLPPDHIAIG
ncbi:MAG: hypothetical protein EBU31_15385, partial [Proteobacteria bacterium]|nr:hypothetical protein [Pseudomonadota bacterium]